MIFEGWFWIGFACGVLSVTTVALLAVAVGGE